MNQLVHLFIVLLGLAAYSSATCDANYPYRSYDGTCNNLDNPNYGKSSIPLSTEEGLYYKDGISQRADGPNERVLSNVFLADDFNGANPRDYSNAYKRTGSTPNSRRYNNLLPTFWQFIVHDLSLIPLIFTGQGFADNFLIEMVNDTSDPLYIPQMTPSRTKIFARPSGGVMIDGKFVALNDQTAWLDGSQIYGPTEKVALGLRTFVDGKLKVGPNNTVPVLGQTNSTNECGSFVDSASGAGDFRSDAAIAITSLHNMWVREHNHQADLIKAAHPSYSDETIYQEARTKIVAFYQNIVWNEALPALIGPAWNKIKHYTGYKPHVSPNMLNIFSSAAMRVPHSLINLPFLALTADCTPLTFPLVPGTPTEFIPPWERVSCVFDFFREAMRLYQEDVFVWGQLNQYAQEADHKIADLMRNIFFSTVGISAPGNLDIEATNIFRGRWNGLKNYDAQRKYWTGKSVYDSPFCNEGDTVDPISCFRQITKNNTAAELLRSVYGKVNKIDPYIGFNMEDHHGNYHISPTAAEIIMEQFKRVRDGDRFWFENNRFSSSELREIKGTSLADLIRRNFVLPAYPRRDAFRVMNECVFE